MSVSCLRFTARPLTWNVNWPVASAFRTADSSSSPSSSSSSLASMICLRTSAKVVAPPTRARPPSPASSTTTRTHFSASAPPDSAIIASTVALTDVCANSVANVVAVTIAPASPSASRTPRALAIVDSTLPKLEPQAWASEALSVAHDTVAPPPAADHTPLASPSIDEMAGGGPSFLHRASTKGLKYERVCSTSWAGGKTLAAASRTRIVTSSTLIVTGTSDSDGNCAPLAPHVDPSTWMKRMVTPWRTASTNSRQHQAEAK